MIGAVLPLLPTELYLQRKWLEYDFISKYFLTLGVRHRGESEDGRRVWSLDGPPTPAYPVRFGENGFPTNAQLGILLRLSKEKGYGRYSDERQQNVKKSKRFKVT